MNTELESVRRLAATLRRQAEAQASHAVPLSRALNAWRSSWDARAAPVVAEGERAKQPAYVARVSPEALRQHAGSLAAENTLVNEIAKHAAALDTELSTLRAAVLDYLAGIEHGLTAPAPPPQAAPGPYRLQSFR